MAEVSFSLCPSEDGRSQCPSPPYALRRQDDGSAQGYPQQHALSRQQPIRIVSITLVLSMQQRAGPLQSVEFDEHASSRAVRRRWEAVVQR